MIGRPNVEYDFCNPIEEQGFIKHSDVPPVRNMALRMRELKGEIISSMTFSALSLGAASLGGAMVRLNELPEILVGLTVLGLGLVSASRSLVRLTGLVSEAHAIRSILLSQWFAEQMSIQATQPEDHPHL